VLNRTLKEEPSNNYHHINDELQKVEERINDIFFRANKELGEAKADLSNLLEGKLNILAHKNDKIEKLFTLTPRIICEIDECNKENGCYRWFC